MLMMSGKARVGRGVGLTGMITTARRLNGMTLEADKLRERNGNTIHDKMKVKQMELREGEQVI